MVKDILLRLGIDITGAKDGLQKGTKYFSASFQEPYKKDSETKIYKLMQARVDTTNGGINIDSIDSVDTEYRIG